MCGGLRRGSSDLINAEWSNRRTVALACLRCHTRLDFEMNHGEMLTAVMDAIARRA